jgi:hypothetical protein
MAFPADIVQQMLAAAEKAAGAEWGTVCKDIRGFSEDLAKLSAETAEDLARGSITEDEAQVLFQGMIHTSAMMANYAEEATRIAAQNAINAAIGVLWTAISSVKPAL